MIGGLSPGRGWKLLSTQTPIQRIPGALSLEVKRPGREADLSPPSNAEVKNAWSYTFTPPILLHVVMLFTLTFLQEESQPTALIHATTADKVVLLQTVI
jgi:hypothetical protein